MKHITIILIACIKTLCLFITPVEAEKYIIQSTVQDYAGNPVVGADFCVQDQLGHPFYGMTDSDGKLNIVVVTHTGIEEDPSLSASTDFLEGIDYNLASQYGKITIFNVLGQITREYDLQYGEHKLSLDNNLASGRYFTVMETPNYKAISSFTFIDGSLIGVGTLKVLKNNIPDIQFLKKPAKTVFIIKGSKTGYESIETNFVPNEDFICYDDIIKMNQIPSLYRPLPDTLWNGINLNYFIVNDDSGVWNADNNIINITHGIVSLQDTTQNFPINLNITYSDSVNSSICLNFNTAFQYGTKQKIALVIVVENNNSLWNETSPLELAFQMFRTQVIDIFTDIFNNRPGDMDNMTLMQIMDVFGEEWQINEIKKAAEPFYNKIISMTDYSALGTNLIDSLKTLAVSGYIIDMIFNLHGWENGVSFTDGFYTIDFLTRETKKNHIPLRALYQTCCYGSGMIDDWENVGIVAVCGATFLNSVAIFSPIYFMQQGFTKLRSS